MCFFSSAAASLFLTLPVASGAAEAPRPLPPHQGVKSDLKGTHSTEHFVIRYRLGSRAGAAVDRTAHLAELEYAEILTELGIDGLVDETKPFELYLYDNLTELSGLTGVGGTAGYSAGRESHVPWDNDQTRKHELVHIVVAAMERTGSEPRNMFFAEGLANAVLEFVHGVPVHAVAAYERERGSLPALDVLAGHPDFYAFLAKNPGLNAYDVAASYFLFLLESYPPRKVMDYYHGKPIKEALGVTLEEAEKAWHARLAAFPVRPGLKTLLSQRRGDGGEFAVFEKDAPAVLPADVLGEPDAWKSVLSSMESLDDVGTWDIGEKAITGENPSGGDWSHLELPGQDHGDCVLRLRAKVGKECWGLKIRYGANCEALVLGQGVFIYTEKGGVAFSDRSKLKPGSELDLVLRVRKGHVEVFVDGRLLLEADLPLKPSKIGLGLVGGKATLTGFDVRAIED